MGRPDDFRSLCYVAVKSGHPALAAARGAERHISTGATLRIKCGAPHLMREIRTSGLMSGDGRRGTATAPVLDSTRIAAIRERRLYKALI